MIEIDHLTLGDIKKLQSLFKDNQNNNENTITDIVGKKCIVRTYSAGCWFGVVDKKIKNEIILKDAYRLHQWYAKKSISLSGVAIYGLCPDRKSWICPPVSQIWLEAIELIPATEEAIESIENYPLKQQGD